MLLLFDIDGTLVLTGGAGRRAMNRAFEDVFGHPGAFDTVEFPGRTDTVILQDALAAARLEADAAGLQAFRARYDVVLADEVLQDGPGKGALPGVPALLDRLAAQTDVFLALLTGNFATSARIKLEHFDLWRYFRTGAFGDDAADRNELVPVAVRRAEAHGWRTPGSAPIVVGDTPRDVACAHAGGARVVAVATGGFSRTTLVAAGADAVVDDLGDTKEVIRVLTSLGGPAPVRTR